MYPYYWSYYPYMMPYPFDPFALMYMWSYLWMYWISMMYYIEMFRVMVDMWRKLAETSFRGVTTAPATA